MLFSIDVIKSQFGVQNIHVSNRYQASDIEFGNTYYSYIKVLQYLTYDKYRNGNERTRHFR